MTVIALLLAACSTPAPVCEVNIVACDAQISYESDCSRVTVSVPCKEYVPARCRIVRSDGEIHFEVCGPVSAESAVLLFSVNDPNEDR